VCLFNRVDTPNRIGSLGTAYPGAEVTIRNPTTSAELPVGVSGEICVRGALVGPGYLAGDTRGLRRVDGWLHSGDRGSMDAEGHVAFEGLIKPMFTRNGFNIYPAELERVVRAMPGVERVEVTAVPEPQKEHEIELTVHGPVDEASVRAWCDARLATYKHPSRITVVA
jgi:fatty-acyl-CoA synthase